jgi:hypothetical protein
MNELRQMCKEMGIKAVFAEKDRITRQMTLAKMSKADIGNPRTLLEFGATTENAQEAELFVLGMNAQQKWVNATMALCPCAQQVILVTHNVKRTTLRKYKFSLGAMAVERVITTPDGEPTDVFSTLEPEDVGPAMSTNFWTNEFKQMFERYQATDLATFGFTIKDGIDTRVCKIEPPDWIGEVPLYRQDNLRTADLKSLRLPDPSHACNAIMKEMAKCPDVTMLPPPINTWFGYPTHFTTRIKYDETGKPSVHVNETNIPLTKGYAGAFLTRDSSKQIAALTEEILKDVGVTGKKQKGTRMNSDHHHVTLAYGDDAGEKVMNDLPLNTETELYATAWGIHGNVDARFAIAVQVEGWSSEVVCNFLKENKDPEWLGHVTVAVKGETANRSNNITEWNKLRTPLLLKAHCGFESFIKF